MRAARRTASRRRGACLRSKPADARALSARPRRSAPAHIHPPTLLPPHARDTVIYAADCARLGRRVAVKAYARGRLPPTKLRAIKREVAMMLFVARARVPHVVEFYGAWQDAERIYIAMELCPGGDLLEALIADRRNMGEARALREVAAPLLAALARLHALRIYHRDVKVRRLRLTLPSQLS